MFNQTHSKLGPASDPANQHSPDLLHEIRNILIGLQAEVDLRKAAATDKRREIARAKGAMQVVGFKSSSFYAKQNPKEKAWDPSFPRSFKLGDSPRSATVWYVDELEAWRDARAASRTTGAC